MPNAIKYSLSAQTLALKKGNFYIGTGDVGKGPTSTTDYYNGITPPSGGYTIYLNKASGGPSIYTASNDSALISLSNTIAGQTFATAAAALDWFATQTDKMVFNRDYESIVTNGLVLNVDAGFTPSYPSTGTTWYDVSSSGNNGTLTNGPTFNSGDGGSIVFDGVDDYVNCGTDSSLNFGTGSATIGVWFKSTDQNGALCTKRESSGFQLYIFGSKLYADGAGTPTGVYSVNNVNTNTWKYGVVVYDRSGGLIRLFVNGIADNTTALGGTTLTDTGSCMIGVARLSGRPNSDFFQGNISYVQIYNRALSAAEVSQNYNAQKGRFGL
jgi:hypothetical protein